MQHVATAAVEIKCSEVPGSVEASQNNHAECRKPDKDRHMMSGFIYIKLRLICKGKLRRVCRGAGQSRSKLGKDQDDRQKESSGRVTIGKAVNGLIRKAIWKGRPVRSGLLTLQWDRWNV